MASRCTVAIALRRRLAGALEMLQEDIARVISAFGAAAKRSYAAGFEIIEIYAAHGFLVHQFLSPISNRRTDEWGGNAENRRHFAVEVAKAVRANWPDRLPLAFRLSATDWLEGGTEIEDTVETARALKNVEFDLIDCSSGGIGGRERLRRMTSSRDFRRRLRNGFGVKRNWPRWRSAFCGTRNFARPLSAMDKRT